MLPVCKDFIGTYGVGGGVGTGVGVGVGRGVGTGVGVAVGGGVAGGGTGFFSHAVKRSVVSTKKVA